GDRARRAFVAARSRARARVPLGRALRARRRRARGDGLRARDEPGRRDARMERRAFARGALTLLLAGAASAACSRAQVDEEPPPVPLPVALRVPGEESIPAGARGDLVR